MKEKAAATISKLIEMLRVNPGARKTQVNLEKIGRLWDKPVTNSGRMSKISEKVDIWYPSCEEIGVVANFLSDERENIREAAASALCKISVNEENVRALEFAMSVASNYTDDGNEQVRKKCLLLLEKLNSHDHE